MNQFEMEKALARILSPGEWFQFPRRSLAFLKLNEAVLLSYLYGVAGKVRAHERHDGWFYHTAKQIEENLYMPDDTQTRVIKALKDKGLLKTRLSGIPAKRYFYLNVHKFVEMIEEVAADEDDEDLDRDVG